MAGVIGIVSGSGLDLRGLLSRTTGEFSFQEELGFDIDALEGHDRKFIRGTSGAHEIILQCGRLHFYEGYTFEEVVSTVDILNAFGAQTILFTNVGGGLRPTTKPGDIVAINEVRTWPFTRWENQPEVLTPDFVVPGCDRTGVYYWMHGPSYETPAEIRALQIMGGDVVGMSTAPEIARCKQLSVRCAAVSVITNNCCTPQVLTHDDVVRVAESASGRLVDMLLNAIHAI
ncbi:MAG: purine-nucleoside phosphorylase [Candidatus Hydrogenedentes bacterium]|nr:purine-nucleoside phosphorylase [Candidatus Hydrogenedentota bacterium]